MGPSSVIFAGIFGIFGPSSHTDALNAHLIQLLAEIKKKNRVIQHYLMSLEPGALISEESDIHKVCSSPHKMHALYS